MDAAPKEQAGSQDAVFAFLGRSSTHGGAEVRRCDTHAAAVFLAGERALKVKRAVRFPFLDYSTLEKRKAACAAELEVNRRFAPQIYRRIVPITREADGSLSLDGNGEAVEWAVEMMRFDENQTLDRIADRGGLDAALPAKLAKAVAAMHAQAEPVEAGPWLAALEYYIGQNTVAFREARSLFSPDRTSRRSTRDRAPRSPEFRPLLLARGQRGLVRRCHGDLHLGNIALLDGEPVAFDAIEFDPLVASGDVLYDLAFLLMDLVERGLPEAANGVLNGYFAAARRDEDCEGLAALPLFMSLRAAIRAKVTAARLSQSTDHSRDADRPGRAAVFRFCSRDAGVAKRRSLSAPAACPAPANPCWRAGLRRSWASRPVRWFCVRTPSARRCSALGETERLPAEAYRPEYLGEALCRALRQGRPYRACRIFRDRRRGVRKARRTRRDRGRGTRGRRKISRLVSHRRSRDAPQADWRARTRRIGRRRGRGAAAGRFCDRRYDLDVHRRAAARRMRRLPGPARCFRPIPRTKAVAAKQHHAIRANVSDSRRWFPGRGIDPALR